MVQSSEYSPIEVEYKIFEFIEHFYNDLFDKKTFESYKSGTINRKRAGYKNIFDEADDLIDRLNHFSLDPNLPVDFEERIK